MNKVYTAIGVIAVAGLVSYLYLSAPHRPPAGVAQETRPGTPVETAAPASPPLPRSKPVEPAQPGSGPPQQTAEEQQHRELIRENTAKAEVARREINALIREYDRNLKKPEKYRALRQQIDTKLAEYNQYVLPVAVSAMNDRKP